jgi:hypothetical protein
LKNKKNTPLDAEFSPIMYLAFPSFQRASYHWTTIIPSRGLPQCCAEKTIWVLWWVLGYCVHSTFSEAADRLQKQTENNEAAALVAQEKLRTDTEEDALALAL